MFTRALIVATAFYLVTVGAVAFIIARLNDAWWLGTVLAFAPKWPWAMPGFALGAVWLITFRWHPIRTLLYAAGALVACMLLWLFPISGLRLGIVATSGSPILRIATYNVGALGHLPASELIGFLEEHQIDAAVFQECSLDFDKPEWKSWFTQKEFSQCFVSRRPPRNVVVRDPKDFWDKGGSGLMTRYDLDARGGVVSLVNVHLETPREGFEALREKRFGGIKDLQAANAARWKEAAEVRRFVADAPGNLVIAGDFNMLQSSAIFRHHFGDLTDAFDRAGTGFGGTKVTRWHRVRIDHVLVGGQLDVASLKVAESLGGDHRPVVVEVSLRI